MKLKNTALVLGLALATIGKTFGQGHATPMPKLVAQNGRHMLMVDGKPYLVLGGQAHNSSSWPGMMPQLWQAVAAMHANTLETPIYWELIEPQQGKFDFSSIDNLLKEARKHNTRLVLLWFGTWKNGSNHYMPGWMKHDAVKYPNVTSVKGEPVDSPSPNVKATLDADIKVFTQVMRYLKKADPQHTVIMMQVENEPGAWGSVRDYSAAAQKQFEQPVPAELLKPEVFKVLNVPVVADGTWQKVYGDNADEFFSAYSIAKYIGQVAAAGKAEYALPMYVNVALRDPITKPSAKSYESGGATDNVIPIYKVAAPAVDFVSPDIYLQGNEKISKVIELYDRPDNTLFVPETSSSPDKAKFMYDVIARGGIGFSPFGIDDNGQGSTPDKVAERLAPFAQEYIALTPMASELAKWGFEGRIKAVVEPEDHADQTIDLGAWQAVVSFGGGRRNGPPALASANSRPAANGKVMIVKLDENKFVMIGTQCRITFKPLGSNTGKAWQYLKVEEGRYENGAFKLLRIRNGDETDGGGPRFGTVPAVLQTTLVVR